MVDVDLIRTYHWFLSIDLFLCAREQINNILRGKAGIVIILIALSAFIIKSVTKFISTFLGDYIWVSVPIYCRRSSR